MTKSPGTQAARRVDVRTEGGVMTLTLDSPHNRNALSAQLVRELREGLAAADTDETVRCVVLTHTGGTFCAGADLSEATEGQGDDPARHRAEQLFALLQDAVRCGKPVIGRIDGHVRAGGMGLVASCDLVVAGPAATFALTEARLGLTAAVISLPVLSRLDDRSASRWLLTAETFDAVEAQRIGLVTEATDDVDAAVTALTDSLLRCSPQGLRETKVLLTHGLLATFADGHDRVVEQSSRLFQSEEAQEGMTAFLERRPPRWAEGGS